MSVYLLLKNILSVENIKTKLVILILKIFIFIHTELFWFFLHGFCIIGAGTLILFLTGLKTYLIVGIILFPIYHYYYYKYIVNDDQWKETGNWFRKQLKEIN